MTRFAAPSNLDWMLTTRSMAEVERQLLVVLTKDIDETIDYWRRNKVHAKTIYFQIHPYAGYLEDRSVTWADLRKLMLKLVTKYATEVIS